MTADEKLPARISHRLFTTSYLELRIDRIKLVASDLDGTLLLNAHFQFVSSLPSDYLLYVLVFNNVLEERKHQDFLNIHKKFINVLSC